MKKLILILPTCILSFICLPLLHAMEEKTTLTQLPCPSRIIITITKEEEVLLNACATRALDLEPFPLLPLVYNSPKAQHHALAQYCLQDAMVEQDPTKRELLKRCHLKFLKSAAQKGNEKAAKELFLAEAAQSLALLLSYSKSDRP
jgi:hypothetical protein